MIDELAILSDFFSKIDKHLMGIVEAWVGKFGITNEIINNHLSDFVKETEERL